VEIGFGSNQGDATFMKSPTHQRELANAIADAAVEYLEHYERRIAGGTPEP
jgi:N-acetylmuramoyl-L-alanine amidase